MNELESLLRDIDTLRKQLHKLIDDKDSDFLDPEIITASQMLNAAIVKYNEIVSKKMGK